MMIIHTPTKEDFINVVEWANSEGITWRGSQEPIRSYLWEDHGSETCIRIENKQLTYGDIEFYTSEYNINITSIKQFLKDTRNYRINQFKKKYDLR